MNGRQAFGIGETKVGPCGLVRQPCTSPVSAGEGSEDYLSHAEASQPICSSLKYFSVTSSIKQKANP